MVAGWKVLALVASVTVVAACGDKSSNSATRSTTTVASLLPATVPSSVPSAPSVPVTTTPTTSGSGGEVQSAMRGAATTTVDAKTARTSIKIAISGFGSGASTLAASGAIDFAVGARLTLRSSASGDKTEARVVDGIVYIQLPKRVAGKSWIAIDSKKVPGLGVADLSRSQSDPGQYLTFLGGVTDDYTKVGTELVRRERTTHYHGVVNVGKAVQDASLPAVLRDRLSAYAPGLGTATFPLEVWIDAKGRARKIRTVRSVAAIVGRRVPGSSAVTVEFFEFGTEVNVEAPPADEVAGG